MAKVVLTVQYEIKDGQREQYLATIEKMKSHLAAHPHVKYSVYEQKGKKNFFTEMFVSNSEEDYKQFEESDDEVADTLAQAISEISKDGKAKYFTLIER
jgi:hypothetical protein